MSDSLFAIRVRDVSKSYDVARGSTRGALYDRIGTALSRGADRAHRNGSMWALRHVDFDVRQGEILGVIGRNGSGKTTLLSILARVTAPTEGTAEIRGRVAPLLQVGAAFHPQLTGRDNVALSGAILGMSPAEVEERFEAIAEFSEVGDYIDQPVKLYSSGMYARLAYSVAAFLPAEIMLVDEVLSVGDAQFQAKSHAHMKASLKDGRTVVYVGHSVSVLKELCDHAIVLQAGTVSFRGAAGDAVRYYEQEVLTRPLPIATLR